MKSRLKLLISLVVRLWDIAYAALLRLVGQMPSARCVVLYYHAVPAEHRALFSRQLDLLTRLAQPLRSTGSPELARGKNYAVVTFDDGFASVKENAAPELARRGIPWTMFVPSGCLGENPAWLRRAHPAARHDRVVTREELRELVNDPLVTIGSHTVAHTHLVEVGPDRARAELAESKTTLEQITARPVDQFSYPFGARTPALDEQARALGYRRLYSTSPLLLHRPGEFVIGRVAVDPDTPLLEFRLKVLGAYRWLARKDQETTDH